MDIIVTIVGSGSPLASARRVVVEVHGVSRHDTGTIRNSVEQALEAWEKSKPGTTQNEASSLPSVSVMPDADPARHDPDADAPRDGGADR